MPTKFKPTQTTLVKGKGRVTNHYYIKNTPKQELIDYINTIDINVFFSIFNR